MLYVKPVCLSELQINGDSPETHGGLPHDND